MASPNWFDPEEYITEADSIETFKNAIDAVPFTVTLPLIVPPVRGKYPGTNEAVCAKEELNAFIAYDAVADTGAQEALTAQLEVPCNDPVIEGAINDPVTVSPLV